MKTSQPARRDARGFTLTELMIVITIMGAMLAVSSPALSRFAANWRLNGATARMAMVMRAARSTAVSKNIDCVFVFDKDAGQYYFIEDTDGDGTADAGERTSTAQDLPRGVIIDSFSVPQASVTFNAQGSTADGGTIVVKGHSEREVEIHVYSGTGNISVARKS
jgi:prepilin-type N-terminal cleavage/methylation domain-containing protein